MELRVRGKLAIYSTKAELERVQDVKILIEKDTNPEEIKKEQELKKKRQAFFKQQALLPIQREVVQ